MTNSSGKNKVTEREKASGLEIGRWIKVGSLVQISPDPHREDWYFSKILEIGERSLWIEMPQRRGSLLQLEKGQKIRASIPTHQGLFLFTDEVLAVSGEENPRLEIEIPQEVVHVERRSYARLPIRIELYYAEIREDRGEPVFYRSYILDISGGGVQLETNRVCPNETLLRLKFHLPEGNRDEEYLLTGRIVRSIPTGQPDRGQAGIEFIDISTRQQESIVRFVLDRILDTTRHPGEKQSSESGGKKA